jgi:F0F1-type ATP synthase assembly protein I
MDQPTPNQQSDEQVRRGFERRYLMLGLAIVGDFGAILAVPAIAGAILGVRLDAHYGTRPWLLVLCLLLAASLSAVAVYRRAKRYNERYQALMREERQMLGNNGNNKDGNSR